MTARCISYSGTRATVVLEPGLLGRLFGRRAVSVDLERTAVGTRTDGPPALGDWYAPASGRVLERLPHYEAIRNALDFREVGSPSRWALPAGEAIAP